MKTNEIQQTEPPVQPQKRTKCFWDLESTLGGLPDSRSERFLFFMTKKSFMTKKDMEKTELHKFFQSLKKFEDATKTKLDLTLLVTDRDYLEVKDEYEQIQNIFADFQMNDRIKDCRCKDMLSSSKNTIEKELWNKDEAVSEYYRKHEENLDDISMCIYAGGKAEDYSMANHHRRGNVYRGIPHAYINTGKDDLHFSSLYSTKGDTVNLPASKKENFQAVTNDLNLIADMLKPKHKLSSLLRKKENININLR